MGLTYRSVKGSALTITELDNNFRHFTGSHTVSGSLTVAETGSFGILDYTSTTVTGSTIVQSFTVASASSVTVNHNLNFDFPIVQCYGNDRVQFIADISSSNANTIIVGPFTQSTSGSIVISKLV
tara:strand:+ start:3960 stop:4334 length:375 start_codon:yes stop_codon:yes gene_type:complete